MVLFILTAVLLIAMYLLTPGPEAPEAASLKDFNVPDNNIGSPVPRLYGRARLFGNCIYYGNLTSRVIEVCRKKLGTKHCEDVGYGYFLDFAYVYAEKIKGFSHIYMDGTTVWAGEMTTMGTLEFMTGKLSETHNSGSRESTVYYTPYYDGPMPFMEQWTGLPIKYKNTSSLVFPQAFIGDNVRSVPQYSMLAWGAGDYYLPNGIARDYKKANPVDVIYDILVRDLKLTNEIDINSFYDAWDTVQSEGIFVGLVMTTEKKVSEWVDRMLKVIDATLYYDSLTNKINIKLFRYDYDPNNITEIDDDQIRDLKVDAKGWSETYNKFTFKYTNVERDKVASLTYLNEASRIALGYDRPKTIQLQEINDTTVINLVANRMVAKLGIPFTGVKFKINSIDYPGLAIGDVFKLNSTKFGVNGKIYRVMKITGDGQDKSYFNIEAIEDFYARSFNFEIIDDDDDKYVPPDYSLPNPPTDPKFFPAPREITLERAYMWGAGRPLATEYITHLKARIVGTSEALSQPSVVCSLMQDVHNTKNYDQGYSFVVNDTYGMMEEIFGTTNSLQFMKHILLIDDELIGFKSAIDLGSGNFEVQGIVRGLAGTSIVNHDSGATIWVSQQGSRFSSVIDATSLAGTGMIWAENNLNLGPQVSIAVAHNRINEMPYKVVPYTKNGDIVWRPRVPQSGANYREVDTIVAGQDEGKVTGYYVVEEPNGNQVTITPQTGDILITFSPSQTGEHKIKHYDSSSHLAEDWAYITI